MIFHVTCLNISPKMLPPCGKKCISGFGSRASVTTGTCHNYPRNSPMHVYVRNCACDIIIIVYGEYYMYII